MQPPGRNGAPHDTCGMLQASSGLTAWTAHLLLLKLVLWLLGVPSAVPLLEAVCYTGYPIVLVCINTVVVAVLGRLSLALILSYETSQRQNWGAMLYSPKLRLQVAGLSMQLGYTGPCVWQPSSSGP